MSARLNVAPEGPIQPYGSAVARCPHLVFRDVLGAERIAALMHYVAARHGNFRPALIRNRLSGEKRVDASIRDNLYFNDLGAFEAPIKAFVRAITVQALDALRLVETKVEPRDLTLGAYRDGGYFGPHIDTDERIDRVRVLSCVYYFAATPRRFSGGELRLYGFPTLSAGKETGPPPFVDVTPETDSMVVFPSWLRHEVLPVRVPSGTWADARFTINCWIHRVIEPAAVAPGRIRRQ